MDNKETTTLQVQIDTSVNWQGGKSASFDEVIADSNGKKFSAFGGI